jgi:predicted ATPase
MAMPSSLSRISLVRDSVEDWERYPFTVPAIRNLEHVEVKSPVLCFAGENGTGKSTLLEALADYAGFALAGGSANIGAALASQSPVRPLAEALRLRWKVRLRPGYFLRAESFGDLATYLDQMAREDPRALERYGGTSLHEKSHGEAFLSVFVRWMSAGSLYLFDEPEAALSYPRQLALVARMHDMLAENADTQFIIATHSPIILGYPGAQILTFDEPRLRTVPFRETDAFRIGARFFADPDRFIQRFLDEGED